MKRSILRILSLVLIISMVFSIPAFAATAYKLRIVISGPTYDYDGAYNIVQGPDATVETAFADSPAFGSSTSLLEALAQVFSLTYDGNYKDADGRRIGSVDDVFTRSSLHQTVINGLSSRNDQAQWDAFINKNITATYETNDSVVDVAKATLKDRDLSISKAYNDAEKDHTIHFVLTRDGDKWEYVSHRTGGDVSYMNTYTDVYKIDAIITTVSTGGNTTPTPTPTDSSTLPISGENTVPVNADINDGTATIPDITDEQINQANATQDSGIVVDASGVEGVQTVELSEDAMETIKDSGLDLEIKLPNATLTIDSETLNDATGGVSVTVTEVDDPSDIDVEDYTDADEEALSGFGPNNIIIYNGNTGANLGLPDDGNTYFVYDPETDTFTRVDNNVAVEDGTIIVARSTDYSGATADKLITDVHDLYLKGYPDGSVQPTGNITRAEVSMAFYRLLKDKSVVGTASYTDVKDDAWYAEAVKVLSTMGIVKGYEDGSFKPDQAITRAEFAAVATRFIEAKGGNVKFKDVPDDFWAKQNISTAAYFGWINGYEDATFRPNNKITRAEAATIINHMLGRNADKNFADTNRASLKQFTDLQDSAKWYYYTMVEATNSHDFTVVDGKETTWTRLR